MEWFIFWGSSMKLWFNDGIPLSSCGVSFKCNFEDRLGIPHLWKRRRRHCSPQLLLAVLGLVAYILTCFGGNNRFFFITVSLLPKGTRTCGVKGNKTSMYVNVLKCVIVFVTFVNFTFWLLTSPCFSDSHVSLFFNCTGWLEHLARRRLKIPSGPRFIVPRPAWLRQKGGMADGLEVLDEWGAKVNGKRFLYVLVRSEKMGLRCDWFWGFRNDTFRSFENRHAELLHSQLDFENDMWQTK